MQSALTLETLADLIRRDPTSWQGVGLLYLKPCTIQPEGIIDHMMIMRPEYGDGVILGKFPKDYIVPSDIAISCRITDISANWEFAAALLGTDKTDPVIPEPVKQAIVGQKVEEDTKPLPTFLVVEDDMVTSNLVTHHLQKFGKVVTAKNAREATAHNTILAPDIIFLDIHYLDDLYDGFDVLTNILSTNKDAFVVMFSADRNPETIVKSLALGAKGYIAKPFHASDFSYYLSYLT